MWEQIVAFQHIFQGSAEYLFRKKYFIIYIVFLALFATFSCPVIQTRQQCVQEAHSHKVENSFGDPEHCVTLVFLGSYLQRHPEHAPVADFLILSCAASIKKINKCNEHPVYDFTVDRDIDLSE